MTACSGWMHDRWGTVMMLVVESVSILVCAGVAAVVLKRFGETAELQQSQVVVAK
jgi:hypothetical protein